MQSKFTFIAGDVLLDVISIITEFRHIKDSIGVTSLNFGGVAYNVAINMRKLGVNTTLMTALNRGPLSQMIINELSDSEVRAHVLYEDGMPDPIYNGIFRDGNEIASVWSNYIEKIDFEPDFINRGLKNASSALVVSSLSTNTIRNIVKQCEGAHIPVSIGGVSMTSAPNIAKIGCSFDSIFVNEQEMDNLIGALPGCNTWADAAKALESRLIITRGSKGVTMFEKYGETKVYPVNKEIVVGTSLGAGDMFMAATLAGMYQYNKTVDESIIYALENVTQVLLRPDANIGKINPLYHNIQAVTNAAHHDKLTGLLNRHGLESVLDTTIDHDNRVFMIIDIDHFKKVNDTYGHDIGDEVLKGVASTVADVSRRGDIVARFGGEEFVCVFRNTSIELAVESANRIRTTIESSSYGSKNLNVTISGGLALWDDGESIEEVLKRADKALYKAKNSGRNQIITA